METHCLADNGDFGRGAEFLYGLFVSFKSVNAIKMLHMKDVCSIRGTNAPYEGRKLYMKNVSSILRTYAPYEGRKLYMRDVSSIRGTNALYERRMLHCKYRMLYMKGVCTVIPAPRQSTKGRLTAGSLGHAHLRHRLWGLGCPAQTPRGLYNIYSH